MPRDLAYTGLRVEASVLVPLVALAVKLLGYGRTHRLLNRVAAVVGRATNTDPETASLVTRVRLVIRAVKLRGPLSGNCLSQSLALWFMLARRGVVSTLRIGTSMEDGDFRAHAWVEHQGRALNAGPRVLATYNPFDHDF